MRGLTCAARSLHGFDLAASPPTGRLPAAPSRCHACEAGTLLARKRYRPGPWFVAVGYTLLALSALTLLLAVGMVVLAWAATRAGLPAEARADLDRVGVPADSRARVARWEAIPDAELGAPTPGQRRAVRDEQARVSGRAVAVAFGFGAALVGVGGALSLPGLLAGGLLVLRRRESVCDRCGAVQAQPRRTRLPMPFHAVCPECDRACELPDEVRGKRYHCPGCGTTYTAGGPRSAATDDEDEDRPRRSYRPLVAAGVWGVLLLAGAGLGAYLLFGRPRGEVADRGPPAAPANAPARRPDPPAPAPPKLDIPALPTGPAGLPRSPAGDPLPAAVAVTLPAGFNARLGPVVRPRVLFSGPPDGHVGLLAYDAAPGPGPLSPGRHPAVRGSGPAAGG